METGGGYMTRPTVMTPDIIYKLEEAFAIGCPDLEACLLAGIGKTTLYNYQQDNPEFVERKEALKNSPALHARKNLAASIASGDLADSKWYLERKKRDEFGAKQDINLGGQTDNPITLIQRTIIDPVRNTDS